MTSATQSEPGWSYGYVPTAGEFNYWFGVKQDALGYTPVNKAGDAMLGYFVTLAPTAASAGFNLPQGTAPTSPNNGDLWTTSSGIYVQINNTTYDLAGLPTITSDYLMANLSGGTAMPTGVSWSAFANAAISNTPGSVPVNISGAWGTLTLGVSVTNPGTGTFESLIPVQTVATTSHIFVEADLFKETRRSNSGTAMTDTFPAGTTSGLANGTTIRLNNADASANDTVTAGAGTTFTIGSGTTSSVVIGPGRSTTWIYDAANTTWRPTANSLSALLSANNLSDVASPSTALANLGGASASAIATAVALRGYIGGLTLSNDGTSPNTVLDIVSGQATSDDNTTLMTLSTAFTKTTAAWAAGSGNGGLDTGSIGASSWYHVYVIENTTGPAVDVLFSLSASSPTMPSGYTKKRRIGSFKTSSSNIVAFNQNGDTFTWITPTADLNGVAPPTSDTLETINVPSGVNVTALFRGLLESTGGGLTSVLVHNGTDGAQTVNTPAGNVTAYAYTASITVAYVSSAITNTSSQVRVCGTATNVGEIWLATYGWMDTRGRFS